MELDNISKNQLDSLALKMKKGNRKAAEALYDDLMPKVYGFFFARVRKKEIAEDLSHDIFVKLIDKIETFDPQKGHFTVWFWQVVRRYAIDYYRTKKDVPFSTFEDEHVEDIGGTTAPVDMDVRMEYRKVREFLETLGDQEKELFELRFAAQMSYRDIAVLLDKPENTLRVQALRIKEKIKTTFENNYV